MNFENIFDVYFFSKMSETDNATTLNETVKK